MSGRALQLLAMLGQCTGKEYGFGEGPGVCRFVGYLASIKLELVNRLQMVGVNSVGKRACFHIVSKLN